MLTIKSLNFVSLTWSTPWKNSSIWSSHGRNGDCSHGWLPGRTWRWSWYPRPAVTTLKYQNIDALHEQKDEQCSPSIDPQYYKANSKNYLISTITSWVSHANHNKQSSLLKQVFDALQDKFHWNQAKTQVETSGKLPIALKTKISFSLKQSMQDPIEWQAPIEQQKLWIAILLTSTANIIHK